MTTIGGGSGGDSLDGSAGNDSILGGAGNDTLNGGDGNDTLIGGADNDKLDGGRNDDSLYGNEGDDSLRGCDGKDTLSGGQGHDTLDGGAHNDSLYGDAGNDRLFGGGGNDYLSGGADNDTLDGGGNEDRLHGDDGDDSLYGGDGMDTLSGGQGHDTLDGGAHNDSLYGNDGNDSLFGGGENDYLSGGGDDDRLDGGSGNDTLEGGTGADSLTGGDGADAFVVDTGGDTITDFDATTGVDGGGTGDNDFVDLSAYYNPTTLAAWNSANPGTPYDTPLQWLRADHGDDGSLSQVGGLRILGADGNPVSSSALVGENTGVVCFAKGTHIATESGDVPIEALRPGDLVQTMDHGLQPLRWIGCRSLTAADLAMHPNLRPIRIRDTVLGGKMVGRDLIVSPQHRILVVSKIAQRMFGEAEVLISAKQMLEAEGVESAHEITEIMYYHILFDRHEIVFANGTPSESLYLGPEALKALSPEGLEEIQALFPEWTMKNFTPRSCRRIVSGRRARHFCWRHSKSHKPPLMLRRQH